MNVGASGANVGGTRGGKQKQTQAPDLVVSKCVIILTINSFKAQFQTAQCAVQLWYNRLLVLKSYMRTS